MHVTTRHPIFLYVALAASLMFWLALLADFIPGLFAARVTPLFINGERASLDGIACYMFAWCAINYACKWTVDLVVAILRAYRLRQPGIAEWM